MIDWEKIRKEFEETDITMKALAEKHGVKPGTLRSRKNREGWQRSNATTAATQRNKKKKVATRKAEKILNQNEELLGWEMMFCYEYLKEFNATKAYLAARDVTYNTAAVEGSKTLKKPKIQKAIRDIRKELDGELFIEVSDIVQQWAKQAFANITDFVDFGTEEVEVLDEDGQPMLDREGNRVKHRYSYVYFKDKSEVDGTLIQEVKMGKDGPVLKLYDKQRALKELSRYLTNENDLAMALLKAKVDKLKRETSVDTNTEDKLKEYFELLGREIDGAE
ncbi:terminase small subunit [Bacillus licheniformis]|uniref:terminase small subunit n=1 Tax=Bacillus licheniformis TaxID=1402 RepID=UPI0011A81D7A|nr:terminase small subunit [Bacillus licheniformis]